MISLAPTTPLLQVEDLCVFSQPHNPTEAPKQLLEPLSFSLHAGESLTILGETGAGKSLLMQAIMGVLPNSLYSQGQVWIAGQNVSGLSPKAREQLWGRQIALLPQEPWHALDPLMLSREQVSEVYQCINLCSDEQANQQADADLASVGLRGSEHKRPDQLSGGMAQRLAFCAATAAGATLILADEPTKGLDSHHRETLVQLLCEKSAQGALLTITHDVAVARQIGGRVLVMKAGQSQESGLAEQVLTQPCSVYTRQLIAADPSQWPLISPPAISQNVPKVLIARGLSKKRGGKTLFQDLDLEIQQGEIIGLSGVSGSGKSTLGDILLGLLPADSGQVQRVGNFAPSRYLKLYQDPPAAFAAQTPLGVLFNDLIQLHKLDAKCLAPLLEQLQLHPKLLKRQTHEVSGGELQRLALARALLMKPVFLVADESVSRLDPITARTVLNLLVEVASRHACAFLLVSHDHQVLNRLCHRTLSVFQ